MNHKKIIIILVAVTLIGFWWFSSRDISYKTDNFPLKENWKVMLDFPINHLTLAGDEILLVRTNARLYALDTTTSEIIWQHKLFWKPDPESAIVDQGKVFLSDGKEILALNLASGEVIWSIPNPERNVEVNAIGTNIVTLQVSQRINVYDANSGSFVLSKPACRSSFDPYIYLNLIYIPCYGIKAIHIDSGETDWEYKLPDPINLAVFENDVVYFPILSQSKLVAFNLIDKSAIWRQSIKEEYLTAIVIDENFLIVTDTSELCFLRKDDGEIIWCLEAENAQSPTIIGSHVYYFDDNQDEIMAVDLSTGKQVGSLLFDDFNFFIVRGQFLVASNQQLFVAKDKTVYGFGK